MSYYRNILIGFGVCLVSSTSAFASDGIDGAVFGPFWALPFLGLLFSIAVFPLISHHAWEKHQGKVALFWSFLLLVPLYIFVGSGETFTAIVHTAALDYIPFIVMLLALFTTAGGIVVRGNLHGAPATNVTLLVIGSILASIIGTTGASMVLIRPLIRANDNRKHNVHVVIFFIFLVSNIGGSSTPLGDPPLFLGFLKGVSFFWTTLNLYRETLFVGGIVLACFIGLDIYLYRKEGVERDPTPDSKIQISGSINLVLIGCIIAAVLMSASWKPGVLMTFAGIPLEGQDVARDVIMILVTLASLQLTKSNDRKDNEFSWGPILEVAKLFSGIFMTMIPVIAMLKAGPHGAFAPLVALVSHVDGASNPQAYFWLTGILSSFLDNAPTYLVFFELAGGDAQHLMNQDTLTLIGISAGAVFMGANTYIGNAPNFMVYAIAKDRGVKMPSFFGYMLWSGSVLIPTFLLTTLVFFS
jgi:Na+/H+ antiporter NhaD/arsenite permease-like protein